ncbi:glycosyltransferase family 39 protein [Arthrobacter sp. NamB2]|uniref:glycosyltransferase family 39 protein n=1 Tax=Arthrobacter sp. NamB2 TaxID=2576035 RepID=UPI0016720EBD|nr:glycosyltransferase family 39 protein [Arthrobacter sp. NamB2]
MLGFLISFAGAWIPSPWLDEAATAHIISYPFADMAVLWQQTDAVFAPYYVFMSAWVSVTGVTPLWLRMPSLLAVGAGTAAMAAAGRSVGGRRAQLFYAAAFALLPRMTAMGIEARPYALSSMFMAFALLAVVKLRERSSIGYWLLLGASMIGAVGAHLFAALPVVGLVAVALILFRGRSRLALLVTSVVAGLVCLPLALAALPQQSQVSWIGDGGYNIADQALVESWFTSRWNIEPAGSEVALQYVAVAVAGIAALTIALALITGCPLPKDRLLVAAVPPALAVAVLWGISIAHEPMLLGRYFTSSSPFVAMLLAECIMVLRPYAKQILASLLVAGCIVLIVAQRQPYAKIPGYDYSFIASALHDQAENGDGLLIEPGVGSIDSARNAVDLYPQEFDRLVDIAQPERPPLGWVFASDPPVVDIAERAVPPRVWLVTKNEQDSAYAAQLNNLGFRPTSSSSGPAHTVTLWTQP